MKSILDIGLVTVLFLLGTLNAAYAEEFSAKVIVVIDGDTVLILRGNKQIKVRLAGIDAPEKMQAFGENSTQSLAELVLHKQVRVDSQAMDSYGRMVAQIKVDELNVNYEQVQRGMAWAYSRFNRSKTLLILQNGAMEAKRGLWAQADPIPPKEWRKTHATSQQQYGVQNDICGSKRYCSQMSSCNEANFYLSHCNARSLDKNHNGVPCENLCGATK
ncbi:thermonuclease family protein [Candidatus Nitrotoga arctica]|uniref:Endonuclease YncB, thermonuclease family n=1 Tax=Candidatus Nitrotoga arctica TaxID=453162 RepID=A0ABM8YVG8_9PROT|nr:thermonuclease family protein [Candidatus Nitrotoga arctica]CAG9931459.1 Endonuclease YncB, thermonuclease family [Candidatus Nitrotoga arctica]